MYLPVANLLLQPVDTSTEVSLQLLIPDDFLTTSMLSRCRQGTVTGLKLELNIQGPPFLSEGFCLTSTFGKTNRIQLVARLQKKNIFTAEL